MKKLFTLGIVVASFAIAMVACTKNNSVTPTSTPKNLSTFVKRDTVTPPHASIAFRDTVTPPKKSFNSLPALSKKDTVTPPKVNININRIKRDTVTPPHAAIAIRDTVTPPRKP